jgi:hypothetical protein
MRVNCPCKPHSAATAAAAVAAAAAAAACPPAVDPAKILLPARGVNCRCKPHFAAAAAAAAAAYPPAVAPDKILLGVNFYGVDFVRADNKDKKAELQRKPIIAPEFLAMLEKVKPKLAWDAESAEHMLRYKVSGCTAEWLGCRECRAHAAV